MGVNVAEKNYLLVARKELKEARAAPPIFNVAAESYAAMWGAMQEVRAE
jgi:hypothetical protein